MFRMGIPNQSAEEQRKQVRKSVRNSFLSFAFIVGAIRAGKLENHLIS
jgi:hypothetical protein